MKKKRILSLRQSTLHHWEEDPLFVQDAILGWIRRPENYAYDPLDPTLLLVCGDGQLGGSPSTLLPSPGQRLHPRCHRRTLRPRGSPSSSRPSTRGKPWRTTNRSPDLVLPTLHGEIGTSTPIFEVEIADMLVDGDPLLFQKHPVRIPLGESPPTHRSAPSTPMTRPVGQHQGNPLPLKQKKPIRTPTHAPGPTRSRPKN
jgi:hypothetical protein